MGVLAPLQVPFLGKKECGHYFRVTPCARRYESVPATAKDRIWKLWMLLLVLYFSNSFLC